MIAGDRLALAKLLTMVENDSPHVPEIMERIFPLTGRCRSIGVTGPPGAGKSTLVDALIARMRSRGRTVGVIAIDPSSPFSGGAVLGDRIRMQRHALDDGVFIRSFSTRGSHGGLSRATGDALRLFDASGLDRVIVETVGVGQTELDVMNLVDITLVVLVPESGVTVQTMKAGLMEIADLFIVNKADREGAQQMERELKAMVEMNDTGTDGWKIPVLLCQANKERGIDSVEQALADRWVFREASPERSERISKTRRQQFLEILFYRFQRSVERLEEEDPGFRNRLQKVEMGTSNPYREAQALLYDPAFFEKLFPETEEADAKPSPDPRRENDD